MHVHYDVEKNLAKVVDESEKTRTRIHVDLNLLKLAYMLCLYTVLLV